GDKTLKPAATVSFSPMTLLVDQTDTTYRKQVADEMPIQPVLPAMKAWLIDPEENEPLSLCLTDALLSTAEAFKANLAACLSDNIDTPSVGNLTVAEFLSQLKHEGKTEVDVRDRWMVVRPKCPIEDQQIRIDRRVAATFLHSVAAKGRADLEDYATFLAQI